MTHIRACHNDDVTYCGIRIVDFRLITLFFLASWPRASHFYRPCYCLAYIKTGFKPCIKHLDRYNFELLFKILDERQLDFKGMFPKMGN